MRPSPVAPVALSSKSEGSSTVIFLAVFGFDFFAVLTAPMMPVPIPYVNTVLYRNLKSSPGEEVIFDSDLAELYGVETKVLNRAVKRNADRFPNDFIFQLTPEEYQILRCQIGTSSSYGGRRFLPYAFTEQGVAMISGVLQSKQAIAVHISIIRTFAKLRRWVASHQELSRKLILLEQKYDGQFKKIFDAIHELMSPPIPPKRKIGFLSKNKT